jgi:hypothetical protein
VRHPAERSEEIGRHCRQKRVERRWCRHTWIVHMDVKCCNRVRTWPCRHSSQAYPVT